MKTMSHADSRKRRAEIAAYIRKHPELTYGDVATTYGLTESYIGELARKSGILRKPNSGNWR